MRLYSIHLCKWMTDIYSEDQWQYFGEDFPESEYRIGPNTNFNSDNIRTGYPMASSLADRVLLDGDSQKDSAGSYYSDFGNYARIPRRFRRDIQEVSAPKEPDSSDDKILARLKSKWLSHLLDNRQSKRNPFCRGRVRCGRRRKRDTRSRQARSIAPWYGSRSVALPAVYTTYPSVEDLAKLVSMVCQNGQCEALPQTMQGVSPRDVPFEEGGLLCSGRDCGVSKEKRGRSGKKIVLFGCDSENYCMGQTVTEQVLKGRAKRMESKEFSLVLIHGKNGEWRGCRMTSRKGKKCFREAHAKYKTSKASGGICPRTITYQYFLLWQCKEHSVKGKVCVAKILDAPKKGVKREKFPCRGVLPVTFREDLRINLKCEADTCVGNEVLPSRKIRDLSEIDCVGDNCPGSLRDRDAILFEQDGDMDDKPNNKELLYKRSELPALFKLAKRNNEECAYSNCGR